MFDHETYTGNIHAPYMFQWVSYPTIDVEDTVIGNRETRTENSLKVMGFYNSKGDLKILFERHVLETSFHFKVPYFDRI